MVLRCKAKLGWVNLWNEMNFYEILIMPQVQDQSIYQLTSSP